MTGQECSSSALLVGIKPQPDLQLDVFQLAHVVGTFCCIHPLQQVRLQVGDEDSYSTSWGVLQGRCSMHADNQYNVSLWQSLDAVHMFTVSAVPVMCSDRTVRKPDISMQYQILV